MPKRVFSDNELELIEKSVSIAFRWFRPPTTLYLVRGPGQTPKALLRAAQERVRDNPKDCEGVCLYFSCPLPDGTRGLVSAPKDTMPEQLDAIR